jgi:NTE family protein
MIGRFKVGLALGGGGARGLYHIGVIKALEELKIKVDTVAGTSMGAIVGGVYACTLSGEKTEQLILGALKNHEKTISSFKTVSSPTSVEGKKQFLEQSAKFIKKIYLWNLRVIKPQVFSPKPFFRIIKELFNDFNFTVCKIPFYAIAVDIEEGEVMSLNQGLLWKAVTASCAIPGFFAPVRWGDKTLVDGGALLPVPSRVLKSRDTFIIGVGIENHSKGDMTTKNAIDMMFRADQLRYKIVAEDSLKESDFMIDPQIEGIGWADFDKAGSLIEQGYQDTISSASELKKAIRKAKLRSFFTFS